LVVVKVQPASRPSSELAATFALEVDRQLDAFLERQAEGIRTLAPEAVMLLDELRRTLSAGGKRLRPLFCYWGYRAGGGEDAQAIARAGAALELLHTFAVIHDDVMDRSRLRRGQPTSYRRLAQAEAEARGRAEVDEADERFGRSAAVLTGNLGQTLADELLRSSGFPPDRLVRALGHFNEMRVQAVAGELLDLLLARRGAADEAAARRVASLKSASYTVVGPLLLGAALAGAGPALEEALASYGWALGEAFQLRDDVLGTFGDPLVTGKDRDTDILEGKQTALVAKARRLAGPEEAAILARRVGEPALSPGEVERVRGVLRSSGALAETVALIDGLSAKAASALDASPLPMEVRTALVGLSAQVALVDP
jgi:geranylgeranyl diphosphate synthase, type I